MQTRSLGPGAPLVSAIGFGAMPLSIQGRPDESVGIRVIHAALDAGVTLIDTANVYCLDNGDIGHNERLIARALKSWSGVRASVLIATKGGLERPQGRWESDARPERLKRACEHSLEALDVDCIALYQLHAPDPQVPFVESVGVLAELQREGKIRWLGLSNVSVDQIKQAQSIVPIVTVQNRLSPFARQALNDGVVRYCAERGIGLLAFAPLGGAGANKTLPQNPALLPIANRHGASAHAIVLAWLLAQAPNIIPIPGARTVEHAVDSARAAELSLSEAEREAIDQARF
jgi:aryl-alcohol dehydrogenase-like predicted oxidoreductase